MTVPRMRLNELRGLPVIDPTAARKIGTVVDYQVDPASGRIAALDIDGVGNRDGGRILGQRIRRVGRSAVILTGRGGTGPNAPRAINERWLDTSTLVGLEVMGDDGNRIGRIVDAVFDQDTLEVEAYRLRSSGWRQMLGRGGRIQPPRIHACSRELMIVSTGRLEELTPPPTPVEDVPGLSLRTSLKDEDRVAAPSFDTVHDGQAVAARRN
jgi:sporulation protein YlmC with PRC-barrel domain